MIKGLNNLIYFKRLAKDVAQEMVARMIHVKENSLPVVFTYVKKDQANTTATRISTSSVASADGRRSFSDPTAVRILFYFF